MDIRKFFTPDDIRTILTFMARAGSQSLEQEALAYLSARQKLLAAHNYLLTPPENDNGNSEGPAE